MVGEHIHWYITDRCNLSSGYCFKPNFPYGGTESGNVSLAHILADSAVSNVTLGGGERSVARSVAE